MLDAFYFSTADCTSMDPQGMNACSAKPEKCCPVVTSLQSKSSSKIGTVSWVSSKYQTEGGFRSLTDLA